MTGAPLARAPAAPGPSRARQDAKRRENTDAKRRENTDAKRRKNKDVEQLT